MSILTPQEQVGFHREKGFKVLLWSGFMLVFALTYYFWLGPYLRDATGRVNALMYAYYELFGIEVGALVLAGIGVLVSLFSISHFRKASEIKRSAGL